MADAPDCVYRCAIHWGVKSSLIIPFDGDAFFISVIKARDLLFNASKKLCVGVLYSGIDRSDVTGTFDARSTTSFCVSSTMLFKMLMASGGMNGRFIRNFN